jgi:hypothetical protein
VTGAHVTERLSAYMDGELDAPERETVAAHLRACAACVRHLEELRAVDTAARELPLAVPDGYFETFRGSLRARLQQARPRPRRRAPPVWALAAAAAVVLALITPRLLVRDQPARVPPPAPATTLPGRGPEPVLPAAPAETRSTVADKEAEAPRAESAAPPAVRSGQRRLTELSRSQVPPPPAATPEPAQEQAKNEAGAPTTQGYAAAPPAEMDEVQAARPKTAAPAKKMEGAPSAAAHEEEAKGRRDKAALGASRDRAADAPAGEDRFQLLARRTASSADDARALRDAWGALARDLGTGSRADEARVRAVEAGIEAWRRSGDEGDRAAAQRDARAYLERPDALQPARVRDALKILGP